MKKSFLVLALGIIAYLPVQAQLSYGVKVGLATTDVKPSDLTIRNSATDSFRMRLENAGYGLQFGGFLRFKLLGLYVQPELIFNSTKATYNLKSLTNTAITDSVRSERFNTLDLPIMFGISLMKTVRINVGPVAHIAINSSSDLTNYKGYDAKLKAATWGYQAGVGLSFGKLGLDVRYEGNFSNYGTHLNFGGTQYNFDQKPSRIIANVSYTF